MDDCRAFDYVLAGKERISSIIEFRSRSGELSLYQCVRVECTRMNVSVCHCLLSRKEGSARGGGTYIPEFRIFRATRGFGGFE
jgi:hypothetical protein